MNISIIVENMSWGKCSNLMNDSVIICHGSDLLAVMLFFRKFIIIQAGSPSLYLSVCTYKYETALKHKLKFVVFFE